MLLTVFIVCLYNYDYFVVQLVMNFTILRLYTCFQSN